MKAIPSSPRSPCKGLKPHHLFSPLKRLFHYFSRFFLFFIFSGFFGYSTKKKKVFFYPSLFPSFFLDRTSAFLQQSNSPSLPLIHSPSTVQKSPLFKHSQKMTISIARKLLSFFLIFSVGGLQLPQCEWTEATARLIAIGDLHGDYEHAEDVFTLAGVVERDAHGELRWSGGNTTLVQLGDVFDRGPDSIKLFRLIQRLKQEAHLAGGELVSLMGNHELMNLGGMLQYVNLEELRYYGGKDTWNMLFHPTEGEYGKIISKFPIIAQRGGYVFVHAGCLDEYAVLGVDEVNRVAHDRLDALDFSHPILTNNGPLWTRAPIQAAMRGQCALVEKAIASFNRHTEHVVRGIVVGHTVQGEKVGIHCNGKLIGADIGISRYVTPKGNSGYVELFHNSSMPKARYPFPKRKR